MRTTRCNGFCLVAVAWLLAGCGAGESLEKSAEHLSKVNTDLTGHAEANRQLAEKTKEIEELKEQIRRIKSLRTVVAPSEIVGTYKNIDNQEKRVRYNENTAKFEFILNHDVILHYIFDDKRCVFVCEEIQKSEAYYFPTQGVIAFSGYDNEKPTFWVK
jgi:hypothetical protein